MFEELMTLLQYLEGIGDIFLYINEENRSIDITFEDFEGFDDNWDEIHRDYVDDVAVNHALEMLYQFCSGDFYKEGDLNGYHFQVGWESMEI